MDLEQFGQQFRELREGRGRTQDDVIEGTAAYSDARTLRKIEAGQQRPRRDTVILLLHKGLEERDPDVIDVFLRNAGYEPLRDSELAALGLVRVPEAVPTKPAPSATAEPLAIPNDLLARWRIATVTLAFAAILLNAVIRNAFIAVTTLLYAALFANSVLLESAHDIRRRQTNLAASLAFTVSWSASLLALWADIAMHGLTGVWVAMGTLLTSAALQWFLVQPALQPYTVVPASFQAQTSRAAHLKNTSYFLLLAFSFWIVPAHCVLSPNSTGDSTHHTFCPPPLALWILLVIYIGVSVPMGHFLLTRLKPSGGFDRYLTLFHTRALLSFLLSIICLFWYWTSRQ